MGGENGNVVAKPDTESAAAAEGVPADKINGAEATHPTTTASQEPGSIAADEAPLVDDHNSEAAMTIEDTAPVPKAEPAHDRPEAPDVKDTASVPADRKAVPAHDTAGAPDVKDKAPVSADSKAEPNGDTPEASQHSEDTAPVPANLKAEPAPGTPGAPHVEAPAGQPVGDVGGSKKQPEGENGVQPGSGQETITEQPSQAGEEAGPGAQPGAAVEPADVAMTDTVAAAPAAKPVNVAITDALQLLAQQLLGQPKEQPQEGAAAGSTKIDPGAKGQAESRQPSMGSAGGKAQRKMATPKRGKGAARKGPGRMRSTRSQKLASDEEDAADEAAAAAAPESGLTTRRSLRSRTTSHKIDPAQFAVDDEADEEKEERSSPGAGAADAAQAGGNRSRDGSVEGTHGTASQAAADSAGAATESKGDSDDNIPLAQIAEADAKKKRPAPSPAAAPAARKRQKAGSKPATPAPAVKAELPPAAAPEKAGSAAKRAKKQPDQASADRDASPTAPAGKPAQKPPAEDAAAKSGTAVKPPARPAQQQKQHTVAQQPKQQQKSKQPASAAAAVESGQGNEGGEGKKQGEQSLDPMTLQGKQISDELDKAFGEFHALQKKQADIAHKVQGYLGHLDSMHFSIQQLRETMVGRSVKKISKWQLETTCRDAAAHAKQLCDVWMKETKDRQVAPAENRSKPQPATKAPIPAVRVPNQEQKIKSQVAPAVEAKTNVTSLAAAPNALSLRTGQGVAAAPSREPTASTAAPAASKKLHEAREWCLQHLTPAPTGNALRDQGVLILWTALMPHAELPPAEAARKLEAAVHDYYARGNGDNAVADPGADYMRRLRVLWSWLSPDSQHAEPQLKRMLLQGELSAEEVASLDGQQLEALVRPPAAAVPSAPDQEAGPSADATRRYARMEPVRPDQAPTTLSPAGGPFAGAQGSSKPAKALAADTGQQLDPPQQQQQQQAAAEQAGHVSDMDIDWAPGRSVEFPSAYQQLGGSAAAPRLGAGLTKELSLQMWGGVHEASLDSRAEQAPAQPAPHVQNGGAAEPHAAASEQLPAASEEPPPPPPPPADVPDLAAAANLAWQLPTASEQPPPPPADVPDLAAASAANVAQQPEPVTPASSPRLGEGMQPRGWQSAPPGSDLKTEFSAQQQQGFSSKAGVLFESNGPGSTAGLPRGQGSDTKAVQLTSTGDAQPLRSKEQDST